LEPLPPLFQSFDLLTVADWMQSPLGEAVLVAEDMNNYPSHDRMDLINRMADELRASHQVARIVKT
jgi:hypothetical protein